MKMKIKKESLFKILMVLGLIALIAVVSVYVIKLDTDEIENYNFYQYYGGRKVEYEGALQITKKDGITELKLNDANIMLDSTPIYYKDLENRVFFPEDMAQVLPNDNCKMYKINRFTNIYKKDDVIYADYRDWQTELSNSFIYDGQDLYFFIQNTTLTVDGVDYEITPLSYVISSYQNSVEIYNKQDDTYLVIPTSSQNVTAKTEGYSINLSLDTIKYGEKEQLLLRNISELKSINTK